MDEYKRVKIKDLDDFVRKVFMKLGVPEEDARITADVLIRADRRGVESHGVARLARYVKGIKDGLMNPRPNIRTVKETPVSLLVDGDAGLGQVVAYKTMKKCIEKTKESKICMAAVRNSNHYGIAAYYALMALEEGFIGISLTNSAPLVVPTFGKDAVLGTNPISVAVPGGKEGAYVLDMATSTVPRGKLEVYNRKGKKIPLVWATDEKGNPTDDPSIVLKNLLERRGGGLLPLGGAEEETGGHKGYGLALLVDIFAGVLSGGSTALDVYGKKGQPPDVCHFFACIDPELFVTREELEKGMDHLLSTLRNSTKREGYNRIYIHGEKEFEKEKENTEEVPLYIKVYENIKKIGEELGVEANF